MPIRCFAKATNKTDAAATTKAHTQQTALKNKNKNKHKHKAFNTYKNLVTVKPKGNRKSGTVDRRLFKQDLKQALFSQGRQNT